MGEKKKLTTGLMVGCVPDLEVALNAAFNDGYKYIAACFAHPRCLMKPDSLDELPRIERADLMLSNNDWCRSVVGLFSPWINVDSDQTELRALSQQAMSDELTYAAYLSLPALLPSLTSSNCVNLARITYDMLTCKPMYGCVWVHLPATAVHANDAQNGDTVSEDPWTPKDDPWTWWNTFRTLAHHNSKIFVALEVPTDVPDKAIRDRWLGEPIRCLILDTSVFMTNASGFPVLSRAHQAFVQAFYTLNVQVIIKGSNRHGDKGMKAYRTYLEWLHTNMPNPDLYTKFAQGYEDYLQIPLQPLGDHLEASTYDIFEQDPTKYTYYGRAVEQALTDRKDRVAHDYIFILMVLGAGRGPLVSAALAAAKRIQLDKRVRIYAVEKNPSAVVTLHYLRKTKWVDDSVEVVAGDMREWNAPNNEKADIIISELLGSFADNELSPECLDGALRLMKADGISIPCTYTSYIAPMQSHRLYNQTRLQGASAKEIEEAVDMPYVVRVHNRFQPCDAKALFTFEHPNWELRSNSRYAKVQFILTEDCILHGLVGYFDTVLYKSVTLSTLPSTHSPGLVSWFPIIFPLRGAVHCKAGQRVVLHFWRLLSKTQVWYEWCLSEPIATPVQNANGSHCNMKLQ